MWGKILPWFTDRYRVVLLDHVGSGGSDQSAYDSATYSNLDAYVDDLMETLQRNSTCRMRPSSATASGP